MKIVLERTGAWLAAAVTALALGAPAEAAPPPDTFVMAKDISDIITLDPAEVFEFSGGEVIAQLYDRVMTYEPNDLKTLVGGVVESWELSNNGKTITIAVSRLTPKTGTAKSTVFTNPGGPGGPGRTMPLLYLERPKLSENADIIGIDVRGTGGSSNVTCGNVDPVGVTDPRDRSKANLDLLYGAIDPRAAA